jgi:hypothetical protein
VAEVRRLSPFELWQQAGGDPQDYRQLMREHGHLVPGTPQPLPCGWPGGSEDDDTEHCAWCAASGEMQSFNGQHFCDEDCAERYRAEWEGSGA